ncbi:hypothetical protein NQ318_000473 [Aromia moschata]|uniref:Uncharacterized protein n=1 Tax=Aromia moschata TaxID=1265417 RepID=A0AAV8YST5_9CUCU|nr:hypothetical protein NQ318_000473 [Aromia moschata]
MKDEEFLCKKMDLIEIHQASLCEVSITLKRERDVKQPKPIRAPNDSQRQKQTKTLKNIGKLIREDRRLSIQGLAEITGVNKRMCSPDESFNMRTGCAKMMPKLLAPEQKESKMNICSDILNNIVTDPGLLDTVITFDDNIQKCGSG